MRTRLRAHADACAQGATPATFPSGVRSFDVRAFGAKGDSASLDTDAINRAIEAAAAAGGGTVYFPSGIYSSFSIHLESNVARTSRNISIMGRAASMAAA